MASCSGNGSRGHHKFTLNVNETGTNTSANTSTVSFSLVLSPIQTGWDWSYSSTVPVTYSININGTTYSGNIMSYNDSSTVTIRSGSLTVGHNNDGSKTMSFSFSISDKVGKSYTPGNASGSGSLTLTKIPRASGVSVSSNNINIGDTVTIKVDKKVSSYTHTLVWSYHDVELTLATGLSGNFVWDTSNNADLLYSKIPNSNSSWGTFKLTTYNGNTSIGTNTTTMTVNVANSNPIFNNFTYKDTNTSVVNVTDNDQILVKGLSNLQVTISANNKMSTQNYATEKNYVTTISSTNVSANYSDADLDMSIGTISDVGTQKLSVRAYDSRNNSTEVSKDITVYDYAKPIINASVERENNFEAKTTLKVDGSYSLLTINNENKNTIESVQYRYKPTDGGWSSWASINYSLDNGRITCDNTILSLDNTKEFVIEIKATDELSSTTISRDLDVGKAIFFIDSEERKCYIDDYRVLTENDTLEVYSTSEIKTKKIWIDNKPIYRKVIECGSVGKSSSINVSVDFTNIDKVVFLHGIGVAPNGNVFPIPRAHNSSFTWQMAIFLNFVDNKIGIETGSSMEMSETYVIIEYTKKDE